MKEMLHFLGDNNNYHAAQNDEKIEDPKTKIVEPTFRTKKTGKGAPKKEKRPRSAVEKVPTKAQNPPKRGRPPTKRKATSEKGLNTQKTKNIKKNTGTSNAKIELKEEATMQISYKKESDVKPKQPILRRTRATSQIWLFKYYIEFILSFITV